MSELTLVKIKSLPNGLKLVLDPAADFEDILRELGKKCSDGRSFFGKATTAISIEGRELTDIEEIRILETIHINCNLNVICILDHDEDMNYRFIKAIKSMEMRLVENAVEVNSDGHFFRGSLTDGEKLDVDYPIVIMGDINPGCSVTSTGSIIVLGGLYGEAIVRKKEDSPTAASVTNAATYAKEALAAEQAADAKDDFAGRENDDAKAVDNTAADSGISDVKPFIIALELIPERVMIEGVSYKPSTRTRWGVRHKYQPQVAYPKDGRLVVETVSKSVLETVYAL